MHIGLLIYNDLATVSGGYIYDRMLVDYLRRRGDAVDVISLPPKRYFNHLFHNYSKVLKEQVVKGEFDLLLQDELVHPSLFLLNNELRRTVPCPIISIVHHLRCSEPRGWINALYRDIERRYLNSVDGFVFVSRHTARCVAGLAAPRVPSIVAYPGKDRFPCYDNPQSIRSKVSRLGNFNILYIGNVIHRKGLHVLVDALSRLKDVSWRLEVAGAFTDERAYAHFLFRKIVRAGMVKRVHFLGAVPDADLVKHFRESHLLAVPSLHEGFGIAYLEALGFGVPVIASTSGGAGEIVTHGKEGFLLGSGDCRTLAGHIARLNDDRRLLLDMSLGALEKYKKFATWHQSMSLVRGFLEGFMQKRRLTLPEYEYGFFSRVPKQEIMLQ